MQRKWISLRALTCAAVFGLAFGLNTLVGAASIMVTFNQGATNATTFNVPLVPVGKTLTVTLGTTFTDPVGGSTVRFDQGTVLNPDPLITYAVSATNNTTATQTFGFTFINDNINIPAGPTIVRAQLRGSAVDANGNGVTIGAFSGPPQVTVPVDPDTAPEMNIFNLSRGTTLINAGADVGPPQTFAGNGTAQTFTLFTATGNVASAGPQAGPAGPFTAMRADLIFSLTPGDSVSFVGLKEVTSAVPEPASLILSSIACATLLGHAGWRRLKPTPA